MPRRSAVWCAKGGGAASRPTETAAVPRVAGHRATGCSRRSSVDPPTFLRARQIQERLPAGESVRNAVPVADSRLAVLPAQEHDLVVEQAGEIDQPQLRSVDQAAVRVDPLDQPLHLVDQPGGHRTLLQMLSDLRAAGRELGFACGLLDLGADLAKGSEQLLH